MKYYYHSSDVFLKILATCALIIIANSQDWECNTVQANQSLDQIFAKLYTYGRSGRKFPSNQKEARVYCNETIVLVKSAESYIKQCIDKDIRLMLDVLTRTIKSQANQLCGSKNGRRLQELYDSAHCSNAAKFEHQKCINRSIDNMFGMQQADNRMKIPMLCCENERIKECFHTGSRKYAKQCTDTNINVSLRFLDSVTGNLVRFLCSDFDDQSDKCDQLVAPKKFFHQRRTLSFLPPLLKLMNSI